MVRRAVGAGGGPPAWLQVAVSSRFTVSNRSMLPTLRPGDHVLVNRVLYRWRQPRRGEIVLLEHPERPDLRLIKRIVGLPGETVALRSGRLFVDDSRVPEPQLADRDSIVTRDGEWVAPPEEYILLGDSRRESRDSRHFGPVSRQLLWGRVWYRYWPGQERGPITNLY